MKLHYLQHVPYEGLGFIEEWGRRKDVKISVTHLYENESLPAPLDIDFLVIMGGPMAAFELHKYQWMADELRFIRECIERQKLVLGICLGSQLIAGSLGAEVFRHKQQEIGWFPVHRVNGADESKFGAIFPNEFTTFHWHSDTFEMPDGAVHLAASDGCANQAFSIEDRVIGLQFHLEIDEKTIISLIEYNPDLKPDRYVQDATAMLESVSKTGECHAHLARLLDELTGL
jgi:GMP synthase-like glutamine amidotransferase